MKRLGVLLVLLVACSEATGPRILDISTPGFIRLLPDSSAQLTVAVRGADSLPLDVPVQWRSLDLTVATVSPTGLVRAVRHGSTTVIASGDGAADTTFIEVLPRALAARASASADTVIVGDSLFGQIALRLEGPYPDTVADPRFPVIWSSSDTTIGRVNGSGRYATISSIRPGIFVITAATEYLQAQVTLRSLPRVASLTIVPDSLKVVIGQQTQPNIVLRDSAGGVITGRPVAWSMTGSGFTLSATGRVIATIAGRGSISASHRNRADTALVRSVLDAPVRSLAGGYAFTCAVTTAGTTYCWGTGGAGELGTGTVALLQSTPGRVMTGTPAFDTLVSRAFGGTTCGRTSAGQVWCWGQADFGVLGNQAGVLPVCEGDHPSCRPYAAQAADTFRFSAIGVGSQACGLALNQTLWCWGLRRSGSFGDGVDSAVAYVTPVLAASGMTFSRISIGDGYGCGLDVSGGPWCWGDNHSGQIGDGSFVAALTPKPVNGLPALAALIAGPGSTCAVGVSGGLWCWGSGRTTVPTAVPNAPPMSLLIAIGYDYACGIGVDSLAYCWGDETDGKLGNGVVALAYSNSVSAVLGGHKFLTIAAGIGHTCAVATDHQVWCWGSGFRGQLGDGGATVSQPVPVAVEGIP
jgi:alpha-tubulin suppressor-like RCC1 family protein